MTANGPPITLCPLQLTSQPPLTAAHHSPAILSPLPSVCAASVVAVAVAGTLRPVTAVVVAVSPAVPGPVTSSASRARASSATTAASPIPPAPTPPVPAEAASAISSRTPATAPTVPTAASPTTCRARRRTTCRWTDSLRRLSKTSDDGGWTGWEVDGGWWMGGWRCTVLRVLCVSGAVSLCV
jgi:hypothetical protein